MGIIVRRPQFLLDLEEAWRYIDRRNPRAAEQFLIELEKRYQLLSENPLAGTARFRRHAEHRLLPYKNYIVIYRPISTNDGIELVRLIHAARDYRRLFEVE